MDLSPDIDPTEISRIYLINYPDYSNFIIFGQSKDKDTQLDKLRSAILKLNEQVPKLKCKNKDNLFSKKEN